MTSLRTALDCEVILTQTHFFFLFSSPIESVRFVSGSPLLGAYTGDAGILQNFKIACVDKSLKSSLFVGSLASVDTATGAVYVYGGNAVSVTSI